MEIVFFGTGAGKPSGYRNVSSLALDLSAQGQSVWLFDCGEGTQHQMMRSKITPHMISKIFITHLHGDHVFGLFGLLTSRSMTEGAQAIEIYGPTGIKELLETTLRLTDSHMTYEINVIEIKEGVVFENERFTVKALELNHRLLCLGYRVEEVDRHGKLDIQALMQQGLTPGPILQRIKEGKIVQLADGRVMNGADYVGEKIKGRVISILGDTAPCENENAQNLARNADVLVHEATLEATQVNKANQRGHSTTEQAAMLAKKSGVKKLIITHISARYRMKDEVCLLQECQRIFPQTFMAHDLEGFHVLPDEKVFEKDSH